MKKVLKRTALIFVITILIVVALVMMLNYSEKGEEVMPFELKEITIVSTAEGIANEKAKEKWNLDLIQENDLYITVDKNEAFKNEDGYDKIESLELNNFEIEEPDVGEVVIYRPSSEKNKNYEIKKKYQITDSLIYKGAAETNLNDLEINSSGGQIGIRFANTSIGTYVSNKAKEVITHDGTLIAKTKTSLESLKFKVKFDLIINVEKVSYKTPITLELPYGDIIKDGMTMQTIKNNGEFIFKRI